MDFSVGMMATIDVAVKLQLMDCQEGLIAALKKFWKFISYCAHGSALHVPDCLSHTMLISLCWHSVHTYVKDMKRPSTRMRSPDWL